MYTDRQHEKVPSRVIGQPEGRRVQQFRMIDNKMRTVVQGKSTPEECSPYEIVSGTSSILGGLITVITGGRDLYNACKDLSHNTYEIKDKNLVMNNVYGSLEDIGNSIYKAKVQGFLETPVIETSATKDKDISIMDGPIGTRRRIFEGILNTASGFLNMGAGIASIAGGTILSAGMYGAGTLTTGASACLRWWRSNGRKSVKMDNTIREL